MSDDKPQSELGDDKVKELLKEVYGQQNPELKAAFDALSDYDKEMLKRGYKQWKTNGKCEYMLVDANPFENPGSKRGTNFTPKKKKRKK